MSCANFGSKLGCNNVLCSQVSPATRNSSSNLQTNSHPFFHRPTHLAGQWQVKMTPQQRRRQQDRRSRRQRRGQGCRGGRGQRRGRRGCCWRRQLRESASFLESFFYFTFQVLLLSSPPSSFPFLQGGASGETCGQRQRGRRAWGRGKVVGKRR